MIPSSITIYTDALVSLDRIEALLFEAEKYDKDLFSPNKNQNQNSIEKKEEYENENENENENGQIRTHHEIDEGVAEKNELLDIPSTAMIRLRDVTAIRGSDSIILKNISFSLGPNGLTLIVGGNASGKTSLLLSILNELVLTKGDAALIPVEVCVVAL